MILRIWWCSACGSEYRLAKSYHDRVLERSVAVPCPTCTKKTTTGSASVPLLCYKETRVL